MSDLQLVFKNYDKCKISTVRFGTVLRSIRPETWCNRLVSIKSTRINHFPTQLIKKNTAKRPKRNLSSTSIAISWLPKEAHQRNHSIYAESVQRKCAGPGPGPGPHTFCICSAHFQTAHTFVAHFLHIFCIHLMIPLIRPIG